MSAIALSGSDANFRNPVIVSVVGHVLLVVALSSTVVLIPKQSPPQLAIQATLVQEEQPNQPAAAPVQPQRDAAAEAERAREAAATDSRRQQELEAAAERATQQRKQQELQVTADRAAAQERETKLVQQREAEQAAERERNAAAEREATVRRQREAEATAERERAAAAVRARKEAEQRDQARRQAELVAAMVAEEELAAASNSGELSAYKGLIVQRVERKWVQPATAVAGVECSVSVQQLPSGEVVQARVTQCNGDAIVRKSVEDAVYAASPLPLPRNMLLFDRNLTFTFRPQVD